jgi:hypothetical protein
VTVVEVVGSVLVILGALIPVVAACYLVVMVGAAVFVHIPNGFFAGDGGWELVGAITAVLLALAASGSGRYGVDHLVRARQVRLADADASSAVTTTFRPRSADRQGGPLGARDGVRRGVVRRRAWGTDGLPPGRRRCPSPDGAAGSTLEMRSCRGCPPPQCATSRPSGTSRRCARAGRCRA